VYALRHLFRSDWLTTETGELIVQLLFGGDPMNHFHKLLRKNAHYAAVKGRSTLREWCERLTDAQHHVLRPITADLCSGSDAADDEAEQRCQAEKELEGRAAEAQQLRDPFRAATEGNVFGDPFGYSDLCEPDALAVPNRKLPDRGPDLEETAAEMLAAIMSLTDPADTATNGHFERDNRDTLEQMQRSAWSAVEHQLADRDRELREQRNE
jgi:hypothetical protein